MGNLSLVVQKLYFVGYVKDADDLLQHFLTLGYIIAVNGRCEACVHMVVQKHGADLVQRRLHRLNLADHIDAVRFFLRHAFDALDVPSRIG